MNVGTVSGSALRTHVLSHMHANAQANLTRVPHPCTSARHASIFQRVMHPMLPSLPEMNPMLRVGAGAKYSHHDLSLSNVDECFLVAHHHAQRSVLGSFGSSLNVT